MSLSVVKGDSFERGGCMGCGLPKIVDRATGKRERIEIFEVIAGRDHSVKMTLRLCAQCMGKLRGVIDDAARERSAK